MKVLVTGCGGQLGWDVIGQLQQRGIPCRGVDQQDFDLTDGDAVLDYVRCYAPDVIIHCAAYTAVDKAESEPEKCLAVNGQGTMNLVRAALDIGAKMVYLSTDYVFSGEGDAPWETDSPYGPVNVYGLSKLQGETAVRSLMKNYFLIRTSWVFGSNGSNFVRTMLRLGAEKDEIRVVDDQIGSPTYTKDLACLICDMIVTDRYGIYHAHNEGTLSWAQFAAMIMKKRKLPCAVVPVSSPEFETPARRPLNSRLSTRSLQEAGFSPLPSVENALDRYLKELYPD